MIWIDKTSWQFLTYDTHISYLQKLNFSRDFSKNRVLSILYCQLCWDWLSRTKVFSTNFGPIYYSLFQVIHLEKQLIHLQKQFILYLRKIHFCIKSFSEKDPKRFHCCSLNKWPYCPNLYFYRTLILMFTYIVIAKLQILGI